MKRVLTVLLVLAATGGFALTQAGAGESAGKRYLVELDNAFGLVEGADLKIAGVRAGKIKSMAVDRVTKRALIGIEVTKLGFDSLRTDVFCESRPQSLIGEYFIDCLPGTAPEELEEGTRIPVAQTASTVPPDLVNNILRRPYSERLRIILAELGYAVGGRAEDLNDTIRRASPALRETNRVLKILGRQNRILGDLVRDGDTVIGDLAGNRSDVARWVREAGETATASAERREEIAAGLRRLPGFLRELRPTMAQLGRVADEQTPTLVDLNAAAGDLEEFFEGLAPFARSSQLNLRALANAAVPGRRAVKAGRSSATELEKFSQKAPETSKNLGIILAHLDNRERSAVEEDPRSPGGKGYTGFEAILQYVFDQTMAINVFDRNGYMLKVNVFEGKCAAFQNAESLKHAEAEGEKLIEDCMADLGPNQPGVNQPDPTTFSPGASRRAQRKRAAKPQDVRAPDQRPAAPATPDAKPPIDLRESLEEILPDEVRDLLPGDLGKLGDLGGLGGLGGQPGGKSTRNRSTSDALVDFLFG